MAVPMLPRKPPAMGPLSRVVRPADLQLFLAYHGYMVNGTSPVRPDTARSYMSALATLLRHVPGVADRPIAECINKAAITMAMTNLPVERTSTRRNCFFGVRMFARFLADVGLITEGDADAIAGMRLKRGAKPKRAYLERSEIDEVTRRIIAHPGFGDAERLENLTLFATYVTTGLRNSEACSLKVADIDFERGLVHVTQGKGGKSRTVGLPTRLVPLLKAYLEHRPPTTGDSFFVGSTGKPLTRDLVIRRLQRLSAAVGIKFTAHALRRSFATDVAHNRGVSLDKLQHVLGHNDILTTRDYVQTSGNAVALEMRDW